VYPAAQLQVKALMALVQVAPLVHGWLAQLLITAISKRVLHQADLSLLFAIDKDIE
jgi:hypothetical protein